MKHSPQTIQKFLELRALGQTLFAISDELKVPISTLGDWNKRYAAHLNHQRAVNWEHCENGAGLNIEADLIRLARRIYTCEIELSRRPLQEMKTTELLKLLSQTRREYFRRRDPFLKPLDPVAHEVTRGPFSFQSFEHQPTSSAYAANDSQFPTHCSTTASETDDVHSPDGVHPPPPSPCGEGIEGGRQTSSFSRTQESRPSTSEAVQTNFPQPEISGNISGSAPLPVAPQQLTTPEICSSDFRRSSGQPARPAADEPVRRPSTSGPHWGLDAPCSNPYIPYNGIDCWSASARSRRLFCRLFCSSPTARDAAAALPLCRLDDMNADFVAVLEFWEREKGISRDVLVAAVHEALLSAAKKAVGPARDLRCEIDQKNGDIKAYAKLTVSEKVLSKHDQISVFDARRVKPDAQLGDEIEVEVTPAGFGRIASQYAKQSLMQHIRRAEKQLIFSEFKDRVGDIISGTVRRFERSDVTVDLGKYEALLPNRERVPTEEYQIGERIRCYVKAVETGPHGPDIILSRADPQFVIKLFMLEVSEINDGTIEIKGIAREPGFRTKIAVWTRDEKVDPVGACVGLRGQRVKNIVRELNNEKVDIIRWDSNVRNFIANALAPAKLKTFEIDEAKKRVKIMVSPDQLSLAIGKRGQNARLTSKLTGWQVDIEAEQVATMGFEEKIAQAVQALAAVPGITPEQATILVNSGLTSLDVLLQAEEADLSGIPQIGDQAGAILEAARNEAARRKITVGETPATQ